MSILYDFPVWLVYLLSVGFIILTAELGFLLGMDLRRRVLLQVRDTATGAMVGAIFGLLVLFSPLRLDSL